VKGGRRRENSSPFFSLRRLGRERGEKREEKTAPEVRESIPWRRWALPRPNWSRDATSRRRGEKGNGSHDHGRRRSCADIAHIRASVT